MHLLISKYKVDLVVFMPNMEYNVPEMHFYNYGCPILQKNFSNTVMNIYENRTWVYNHEKETIRKVVLLYNFMPDKNEIVSKKINWEVINEYPKITLIKDNDKTLTELSEALHFTLKRNTY